MARAKKFKWPLAEILKSMPKSSQVAIKGKICHKSLNTLSL
ncbi:hypothetical protein [Helicobacter sp. 11S02629-2]|nr:hypothetical protein [Helicobacter sp. 11S02629-2]